jgi:hypothetical protein
MLALDREVSSQIGGYVSRRPGLDAPWLLKSKPGPSACILVTILAALPELSLSLANLNNESVWLSSKGEQDVCKTCSLLLVKRQYFNRCLDIGTETNKDPGQRSRYSDWLLAGRSSSPGRVKNFYFSKSSRRALGSTEYPIQWVPGALSPG